MDIFLLALLAFAGIPAMVMVTMLAGQCIGGLLNCISDALGFFRDRGHAEA